MAKTSSIAVFDDVRRALVLQRMAVPSLQVGEILVRVSMCTLCGSDLHTFTGRRSCCGSTILGHEVIGRIEAIADGTERVDYRGKPLNLGGRVTWAVAVGCGTCFYCQRNLPQKCERLVKYGHEPLKTSRHLRGGLSEYCVLASGTSVFTLPDDLPDEAACPANCATATVAGALRVGEMQPGETVLIQGAGMLGLTAAAMASARGASKVIVTDPDVRRLKLAEAFGATDLIPIGEDGRTMVASVRAATEGRGADLAIELSGTPAAMERSPDSVRIGGRCVFVGAVFPDRALSIDGEQIVRRMLTLRGLHNYHPDDLGVALDFLAANHRRFPLASLVTGEFNLQQVQQAFEHAIQSNAVRVAVRMESDPLRTKPIEPASVAGRAGED
ncbi:MAG: zinc-binding dehydrogenase [Phycisphaeraceae bacterium]